MLRLESAFQVHNGQAGRIGFFPDGRTLFSTALERDEYDLECVLKVWNRSEGVLFHRREYDYEVAPVLSSDGRYLAWNRLLRGVIRIIDCANATSPDREVVIEDESKLNDLMFVPSTNILMFVDNGKWWRWDVTTDWPGKRLTPVVGGLLAMSQDGYRLAIVPVGIDKLVIEYWDLNEFRPVGRVAPPESGGRKAAWHPTRPLLATTGFWSEGAEVWDFTTPSSPRRILHESGNYNHQTFLPDGRLVTGHESGEVAVWDVDAGRKIAVATTSELGQLKLVENSDRVTVTQEAGSVASVAVAPDGQTIAAMTSSGAVVFFDVD